ncbi:ferredoxin--NADP reductase [Chondrinema litorale]|uniref:ferredoxin--NADP reductase n=1 Tax=Chondrinema litorale TaxID=2994555 RepID=UPI0025439409|nr:ferredoxin--NADP reductase [Chondrinema litorale]UZR95872.1 ferredoxin--NADP reductase [Chondrinema litorale]
MGDTISLKVKEVVRETSDTVTVHFKQPLFRKVKYKPGQFLTINFEIDGKKVSRSYSMSSAPNLDNTVAVTVKRVQGGVVSNFVNDKVTPGMSISMMQPVGKFTLEVDKNLQRHIVLFGAGSGVTPLMSILKSVLFFEPKSTVSLVYGNRRVDNIIFQKQLQALKQKFGDRFNLVYCLTQPDRSWTGLTGRIDEAVTVNVINMLPKFDAAVTEYFLCGPDGMMENIKSGLAKLKVSSDKIHFESFTSSNESEEAIASLGETETHEVTILMDGTEHKIAVPPNKSILDTALDEGLDMAFSCQSGLCTACRCKVKSGVVKMTGGDGLTPAEIQDGYVLICVGHPGSEDVVVEPG